MEMSVKHLKLKQQHVVYFEELSESYRLNEYVDEKGICYYTKSYIVHYVDIVERHCLGHRLADALQGLLESLASSASDVGMPHEYIEKLNKLVAQYKKSN